VTAQEDENWNKHYNIRQGFFGNYESENDPEVAFALMKAAESWLINRGIKNILEHMDFSTNHELEFLTLGFDSPPVILLKYTKKYYTDLFENLEYKRAQELYSYTLPANVILPEKFSKMVERARKLDL
jgi:hypothetical protein